MEPERSIINTHDQLRALGGGVAIVVSYGGGRDTHVDGWCVYRVDARGQRLVTDKDAAWYRNSLKWFPLDSGLGLSFAERRTRAAEAAKAWVAKQGWYGGEWKRNAVGDYVPIEAQRRFPIKRRREVK